MHKEDTDPLNLFYLRTFTLGDAAKEFKQDRGRFVDSFVVNQTYRGILTQKRPSVLFSPRGGGKTACRLWIEDSLSPKNVEELRKSKTITMSFTKFSQIKDECSYKTLINKNITLILAAIVSAHPDLGSDPVNIPSGVKNSLCENADKYWKHIPMMTLINEVSEITSMQWLVEAIRPLWIDSPETDLRSYLVRKLNHQSTSDDVGSQLTDEVALQTLLETARGMSVESIVITVDGLDEASTQLETLYSLICGWATDLDFLGKQGLQFKFFLWDKIYQYSTGRADTPRWHGGNEERIIAYRSSWDRNQLKDMMRLRLENYSILGKKSKKLAISEMCDPLIQRCIEDAICVFAERSPRSALAILERIFLVAAQEKRQRSSKSKKAAPQKNYQPRRPRIDQKVLNTALKNWIDDCQNALDDEKRRLITDLRGRALGSPRFTQEQVQQSNGTIPYHDAVKLISDCMSKALITLDANSGEYTFLDCRIAFDVLNLGRSPLEFIGQFIFYCEDCHQFYMTIISKYTQTCPYGHTGTVIACPSPT